MAVETVKIPLDETWRLVSNTAAGAFSAAYDGNEAHILFSNAVPTKASEGVFVREVPVRNLTSKVWARGRYGDYGVLTVMRTVDAGNPAPAVVLGTLTLSATTVDVDSKFGTVVATISGKTDGSKVEVTPSDGRFVVSEDGTKLFRGRSPLSVGDIPIKLVETFRKAGNTPQITPATIGASLAAPLSITGTPEAAKVGDRYLFEPLISGGSPPYRVRCEGLRDSGLHAEIKKGMTRGVLRNAGTFTPSYMVTDSRGAIARLTGKSIVVTDPANPGAGGGVVPLPVWKAARAAVVAGTADTDIIALIDSIGAGVKGLNAFINAEVTSWPTRLAAKLTAAGVPARHWSFTGAKTLSTIADVVAFDPRISFDTPSDWTLSPSIASLGGNMLRSNSPATSRANLSVPDAIDTVRVSLGCFQAVVVGVYVDDNPTPVGTINVTATGVLRKDSFAVPRGVHKVQVARISGGSMFLAGIEVDDTTFKKVRIHNGGYPSQTVVAYAAQAAPYGVFQRIAQIAPSLIILPASVNDYAANSSQASWNAAMQLFIDAQKPIGDILPTVGQPRGGDEVQKTLFAGYWTQLAATNNLMAPRDLAARTGWASVAAAVAAGFLDATERVHPLPAGYDDMAEWYKGILLEA